MISLYSSLSDIPNDETKRVEIEIIDLVDVAIVNNIDSIDFSVCMWRRLPSSSLIKMTPYDKYNVINYNRLEKVIISSLSGLSGKIVIGIKERNPRKLCPSCTVNSNIRLELIAKPVSSYRQERINYYRDTVFKQKLLGEYRQLMEKICSEVYWLTSMCIFPHGVFYYDDSQGAGISFSDLEMANISDSSKRYQMALALMEILNQKGYLFEGPRAFFDGHRINFTIKKALSTVPANELKQW